MQVGGAKVSVHAAALWADGGAPTPDDRREHKRSRRHTQHAAFSADPSLHPAK